MSSLISLIETVIQAQGEPMTTREVIDTFPDRPEATVRTALHRLQKSGRIVGVERGLYAPANPDAPITVTSSSKRRRKKMTVDEYIKNREDMTFITVIETPDHTYEIVLRLDGTYYDAEVAEEQAKFVRRTLGIK